VKTRMVNDVPLRDKSRKNI